MNARGSGGGGGGGAGHPNARDGAFVGREAALGDVRVLLADPANRLVTVTGPGGVGKTRLALELVRDGGHDAAFVPLAPVAEPAGVLPAIASALGIVDEPKRLPARLAAALAERQRLLVLDNLEHLLAAGAQLVALMDAAPDLRVLATSRHRLHLPGERVVDLPPLDPAAAANLFALRVARTPGATPLHTADAEAVDAICTLVDRLPLGIELAAGWTRTVPPRELLPLLDDRLHRLKRVPASGDPRHQTMRDAVAWSYGLLAEPEQALFRRLAVFVGGFTLATARRMVAGRAAGAGYPYAEGYGLPFPYLRELGYDATKPDLDRQDPAVARALPPLALDPLEGLTALLDHSLLRRADDGTGEARYEFLETIREYGLERLAASGEEPAVRHAHAAAMLAFAEATSEGMFAAQRRLWDRNRIEREMPNVRAALTWALDRGEPAAELAQRIAGAMWFYWHSSGAVGEGRRWMERAAALPARQPWARAASYPGLGFLCWVQGDDARAAEVLDEAAHLTASLGLTNSEGSAHFYRALVAWRKGPGAVFEMVDHLERALALFRPAENAIGIGVCDLALGVIARMTENLDDALALFEEARGLFVGVGYEWGIASSRYYAGEALRDLAKRDPARMPEALAALREALLAYRALGDDWGTGGVVSAFACVAAEAGDGERAARLFGAADAMLARMGVFLPPTDLERYRAVAAALRETMGPATYDRGYAAGQALPPDEAVAEALGGVDPVPTASPAHLTDTQRELLREIVTRWPDGRGFSIKALALAVGRDYGSVHELLGVIAHRWQLPGWRALIRYLAEHPADFRDL